MQAPSGAFCVAYQIGRRLISETTDRHASGPALDEAVERADQPVDAVTGSIGRFRPSYARDSLGMVDQGRNVGENTDLLAVRAEEMKGLCTRPDFVAKAYGTWPGAVLNLDHRASLKIAGNGLDQDGTGKARHAINNEYRNGRCHKCGSWRPTSA